MHKIIDARGRSCPEPVLMTKDALEKNTDSPIEVLVDMMVAVENIRRFVENRGYKLECSETQNGYSLLIQK